MAKISVAIATFNEEEFIAPCLESVKWADEIVVVDGSSTDKTRQIAKELGAKVIKTTNKSMFHINKNMAIDACQGDWILQLDADERVPDELAQEMKKIAASDRRPVIGDQPVAYWIKRKNYFLGRFLKKGGQYPDPVIRFFKKGKARLPAKSVHEQMEVKGEVGWLKNDLIHWATPKFSRYLLRENRYSTLEAAEMLKKKIPINPLTIFNYLLFKPTKTFFLLFFRHLGFIDSWQGFVFAFFSGVHHAWAFSKYFRMRFSRKKIDISEGWR